MSAEALLLLPELSPEPEAKPKPERHHCPVGWCRVPLAARAEVSGPHTMCGRHKGKLSAPFARQLEVARRIGEEEFAKVFAVAVAEARRHDPAWRPWAVLWNYNPRVKLAVGEHRRVDAFDTRAQALRRLEALRAANIPATIRDIDRDEELDAARALWRCPHQVVNGGESIQRGRTLSSALIGLWPRPDAELARFEVLNLTTGRALQYAEALALEQEGHHA